MRAGRTCDFRDADPRGCSLRNMASHYRHRVFEQSVRQASWCYDQELMSRRSGARLSRNLDPVKTCYPPQARHRMCLILDDVHGLHACPLRRLDLLRVVGEEDDPPWSHTDFLGDERVGGCLGLSADLGIKVAGEQSAKIAGRAVSEEQELGLRRSRRVDVERQARRGPTRQRGEGIREDRAPKRTGAIAVGPDQPLQLFQRRDFLVAVLPSLQRGDGVASARISATTGSCRWASTNAERRSREYANSTSRTKLIGLSVPSMSSSTASPSRHSGRGSARPRFDAAAFDETTVTTRLRSWGRRPRCCRRYSARPSLSDR